MSELNPKIHFLYSPLSAIFHAYLHLTSYRMKSNLSSLSFKIFFATAKYMQNMCILKGFSNSLHSSIFVIGLLNITNNFINSMPISVQVKHLKLPKWNQSIIFTSFSEKNNVSHKLKLSSIYLENNQLMS